MLTGRWSVLLQLNNYGLWKISFNWEIKHPGLNKGIGKLNDVQVKLHIDESVRPVAITNRKLPFHMRQRGTETSQGGHHRESTRRWAHAVGVTYCHPAKEGWLHSAVHRHSRAQQVNNARTSQYANIGWTQTWPKWCNCLQQTRSIEWLSPAGAASVIQVYHTVQDTQRPLQVQKTERCDIISEWDITGTHHESDQSHCTNEGYQRRYHHLWKRRKCTGNAWQDTSGNPRRSAHKRPHTQPGQVKGQHDINWILRNDIQQDRRVTWP